MHALVERSTFHGELAPALVGEELRDGVAMHRLPRERFENQDVDRALQAFRRRSHAYQSHVDSSPRDIMRSPASVNNERWRRRILEACKELVDFADGRH